ncbi:MAG: hypothetical protein JWP81_1645 [Ferruginibacter sp.]|nr:hypothetical protein [Ferruginibacter sp.]
MEENEGLPLIQYVRDYYMNTFMNYSLGDISEDDPFELFYFSVMGNMYQMVLAENDSYLANLIKAESLESLKDVTRLGYSQAHG